MTNPLAGVADFFPAYWEQKPLLLSGAVSAVPMTLDDVDRMFADHLLTTSTVRATKDGRDIDTSRFTVDDTSLAVRRPESLTVIDPDRLMGEFQRGTSIGFQRIDEFVPNAAQMAQDFERFVGHPVRASAYLTPPRAVGLARHYDVSDVFVVQCVGSKRWQIWERDFPRPLPDEIFPRAKESEPDRVIDLHPGDLLYLPRGWRHSVSTGSEISLAVSFNMRTVARAHVARVAQQAVSDDEQLRAALAPEAMLDDEALVAEIKDTVAQLIAGLEALDPRVVVDGVHDLVHEVRRPTPSVTMQEAIDAIGFADEDRIALGTDVELHADELRRGLVGATPPAPFLDALRRSGGAPVPVAELRGALPAPVADAMLKKLVAKGWLRKDPGHR